MIFFPFFDFAYNEHVLLFKRKKKEHGRNQISNMKDKSENVSEYKEVEER